MAHVLTNARRRMAVRRADLTNARRRMAVRRAELRAGTDFDRDAGMSLIEMLVAIFIFTVLSITVLSVTFTLYDTANASNHRFINTGDVQPSMDSMTRTIRAASTVETATATTLEVKSYLGAANGQTDVTYSLSTTGATAGTLSETDVVTTATGTSSSTRTLSSHIGHSNPVFTYYDKNGTSLGSTPTIGSVAAVTITLVDNDTANLPGSAATVSAQVWMRNILDENN